MYLLINEHTGSLMLKKSFLLYISQLLDACYSTDIPIFIHCSNQIAQCSVTTWEWDENPSTPDYKTPVNTEEVGKKVYY